MGRPITDDGKLIFLPNLFRGDVLLYLCGAADHETNGVGEGDKFQLSSDSSGEVSLDFQFNDWVYIAGGNAFWQGSEAGDWVNFETIASGTAVVSNPAAGNCNLVDTLLGADTLLIPAAGDGSHDVDLSGAIPVPATNDDGFWDWDEPDTGKGILSANLTQTGKYNLFTVTLPLARYVAYMPIMGESYLDLTVPAVKPKKLLPHWVHRVTLHNGGHAGLKFAWILTTARKRTL